MTQRGAYRLAIVCEARADRHIAAGLADRVLGSAVEWLEPESLDLFRRWQGAEEGDSHLEWRRVKALADSRNIHPHGHFQGEPGAPDAYVARRVLLLLATQPAPPDAVVLVRDLDDQEERRTGLEQARADKPWPFPVVLGTAQTKRECWVLCGFEPRNEKEEARLAEVRQELGFDPRVQAHELGAKDPAATRSAKRVLHRLVGDDSDREEACWMESDLNLLEERGSLTGLAEYLQEVRERLVPLFKGSRI